MTELPRLLSEAANTLAAFTQAGATPGDGWQNPADTYAALGALADLARLLPQAITQATVPVTHADDQGRVTVSGRGGPDETLAALAHLQAETVDVAQALARALEAMHTTAFTLRLDPVAEEHRLADQAYADAAPHREGGDRRDDAHLIAGGSEAAKARANRDAH